MIEKYISVQDMIGLGILFGVVIKLVQFFYFDKINKRKNL